MKYIIEIRENENPAGVRFWATVLPIDCALEEETIDALYKNAPAIIRDVVRLSNQQGAKLPPPTSFEFRIVTEAPVEAETTAS